MKRALAAGALAAVLLLAAGCGGSHRCSGTEVVLKAVVPHGQRITPAGMRAAVEVFENRLNKLGMTSPTAAVQGGNKIVVKLANVHDVLAVAKTVDITGQLQIFDFEPSLAPPTVGHDQLPAPSPSLYRVLSAVQEQAAKGSPQAYYLFKASPSHPVLQGPAPTLQQLFASYKGGKQPPHTQVLKVPAGREAVWCRNAESCAGAGSNGTSTSGKYWYLFKLPAAITGKDLVESGIAADLDPNSGQAIVTLPFTRQGSRAFQRMTRAEYNRGRVNAGLAGELATRNESVISRYAGHNAIVLDGSLEETPYMDYTEVSLSDGIVGNAQITEPSEAAANRTALILQSGSLPYTFTEVSHSSCAR